MNVRQLITKLSRFDPDARVDIIGLTCGEVWEPVVLDTEHEASEDHEMGMFVYGEELDNEFNRYRAGALEQLFDATSTGLPDDD